MSYFNKEKFEYYYQSFKNGSYFGVTPDEETKKKIDGLIKKLKIKNPIDLDTLHVTLVYSEDKGNPLIPPSSDLEYTATASEFALYGDESDCLVIKLDSPELQSRHNELLAAGFIHSYDNYSPHITLSYDYDGDLPDNDLLSDLGQITLGEEYSEAISDEWC